MAKGFSTISTGVFKKTGYDKISGNAFYGVLTACLVWGLGGTAFIAEKMIQIGYNPGWGSFIFLGLVIPIIGIFIAIRSNNPIISFIGYNMLVVPFGIIIGPALNQYSPDVIRNAFGVTAGITLVMGTTGVMFPNFFSKIGGFLFLSLLCLLIVRIAQIFIPALDFTWIDYLAAGIFSLYIGFDMYRASNMPKTIDNAIDVSLDLYLDIINLFLVILRIMGKD